MSFFFTLGAEFTGDLKQFGPALWLEADPSTMTIGVGDAVSEWRDKSGNARDFAQGNATFQPVFELAGGSNGSPVISFDGTDDFLSGNAAALGIFNNAPAMTVLAVGQMGAVTTGSGHWFYASTTAASNNRFSVLRVSGGANNRPQVNLRRLDGVGGVSYNTTVASTVDTMFADLAQYNPVAQTLTYRRGAGNTELFSQSAILTTGNTSATNSAVVYLGRDGGTNYKPMKINTIAAWNRALTESEIATIMAYYGGRT
jgi:hypothetical protein